MPYNTQLNSLPVGGAPSPHAKMRIQVLNYKLLRPYVHNRQVNDVISFSDSALITRFVQIFCLLFMGLTSPLALAESLELKLDSELSLPIKQETRDSAVYGTADTIQGLMNSEMQLVGNAELRKPGTVVKADDIRYFNVEDEVLAKGSVRIVRDGDVYTGPELRIRLDDSFGYFLQPKYWLSGREGHGNAGRADFIDRDRSHLTSAIYTTCTAENSDWYLQATSIDLDQSTQTGEARNTVIYFKGVPILASPWISFPLNSDRQSGFLPPTFGVTSNAGVELLVPYYWNMAPNRDLTIYPKIISLRGLQLGADFRYLQPTYYGDVRYEILPNDRQAQGQNRHSFLATHSWNAGTGWSGGWNVNSVSDDRYFVDFSRTIAASSQRTLPRLATLAYSAPYWSLTANVLRYQTLQDPSNPIVAPYEKLPEFLFRAARFDQAGFDLSLDAQLTHFWHPTQIRGDRFVVNPSISYPFLRPGWFITPKFSFNATQYSNLKTPNAPSTGPSSYNRSVPTFSLDAGQIYERKTELFGKAYDQTLEPRIFYVHTPYRDQSRLPNFDTSLADFNFSQIFSENTFIGSDRIADADQLTTAITSRFIDSETGAERFRAAIGQRFYLSPQRVTLPGVAPVNSNKSDFLLLASGETLPKLYLDSAMQYSPALKGVSRSNLGLRWQPEPTKVLNAEYRYVRGQIEQVDFSAQWPITKQWYGVGRVNFSTRDRKMVESVAGIEYKGCCWVVRVVAQRYSTGARTATSTIFLQLELNGLGHIGSNPLEALKRNISGYQVINPTPPPVSPFRNYE